MMPNNESQLASTVLMIRPVRFESNPQTAASNRFQGESGLSPEDQQSAAEDEFQGLVDALRLELGAERRDVDVVGGIAYFGNGGYLEIVERIDSHTIRYTGPDMIAVADFLTFLLNYDSNAAP